MKILLQKKIDGRSAYRTRRKGNFYIYLQTRTPYEVKSVDYFCPQLLENKPLNRIDEITLQNVLIRNLHAGPVAFEDIVEEVKCG